MAAVQVHSEQESPRGWAYVVDIDHDDGSRTSHAVTLAWVDHDHWSGGRLAPSRVMEEVLAYLVRHAGGLVLPARFDAARARRWAPTIDQALRTSL